MREKAGQERELFILDINYHDYYKATIKESEREQAFKNVRRIHEIMDAYKSEDKSIDVCSYCKTQYYMTNEPETHGDIGYVGSQNDAIETNDFIFKQEYFILKTSWTEKHCL